MRATDLLRESIVALNANRMRNLLTVLGVIIGISSVITMMAVIGGIRDCMMKEFGGGSDHIVNISYFDEAHPAQMSDVEQLRKEMASSYDYIVVAQEQSTEASVGSKTCAGANICGTEAKCPEVKTDVKLSEGSFFTEEMVKSSEQVIVIDQIGVKNLFGDDKTAIGDLDSQVIGKSVTIGGAQYSICGVVECAPYMVAMAGEGYAEIYMPLTTFQQRISPNQPINSLYGMASSEADLNTISLDTQQWLARHFGISDENIGNSCYINTNKEMIDQVNGFMAGFSAIMVSVASISLLVGGIGIMNMMLTNVTERIREIGLRKALGACYKDITRQFLLESVFLTLSGGIIGIVSGYLIALAASSVLVSTGALGSMVSDPAEFKPAIDLASMLVVAGVCVVIGVVFGYYPARRAARLDPVEALRYQ